MRFLLIAAIAMAASGCALFQNQEIQAASTAPAVASVGARLAPFRPAFDAAAPVALVPCGNQAALGGTCRRSAVSHERRGDMPAGETSEAFSDATTVSLTTE